MRIDLALIASVAARRAAEAEAKVETMRARYHRDIASAVASKSAVDGKAAAPRLALEKRQLVYEDIAAAIVEVMAEERAP